MLIDVEGHGILAPVINTLYATCYLYTIFVSKMLFKIGFKCGEEKNHFEFDSLKRNEM